MTPFGTQARRVGWLVFAISTVLAPAAPGANTNADFNEIYDLIKAHAAGVTDSELKRAAVQGLLSALGPKVSLVTNTVSTSMAAEKPLVIEATVFDSQVAYLRVKKVSAGLAGEVRSAYERLSATNALTGAVLDLRFADGADYEAAAAVADLFVSKAEPLLNWGLGPVSSHSKTNAIRVPVAVLVNGQTAGAAEALAAALRVTGTALILGGNTAGRAMVMTDFPLSAGGQLRIATAPVTLGDGSAISTQGVTPDIAVPVSSEDERAYYANEFVVLQKSNTLNVATAALRTPGGTNPAARHVRLNEAELVREHREGLDRDLDEDRVSRTPEPTRPLINDPVLARALDLVKGLALVRRNHS